MGPLTIFLVFYLMIAGILCLGMTVWVVIQGISKSIAVKELVYRVLVLIGIIIVPIFLMLISTLILDSSGLFPTMGLPDGYNMQPHNVAGYYLFIYSGAVGGVSGLAALGLLFLRYIGRITWRNYRKVLGIALAILWVPFLLGVALAKAFLL